MEDWEIYGEVEKTIDYAQPQVLPQHVWVSETQEGRRIDVKRFMNSSTAKELRDIIKDLEDYIEGGSDRGHKQLREGYGHLGKPEAGKLKIIYREY